jgi:putative hydrolase of HD superfamily
MKTTTVIEVLLHGNQLKRTVRTGWVQRGIVNAESVAAHSYGVIFVVMVLAESIDMPMDVGKALAMAALHDLPEGLTSDIPTPAWQLLPSGVKAGAEREAMGVILSRAPFASRLMDLWEELIAGETAEAKLVHDADKLDMFLQAIVYEGQTGNQRLDEFWHKPRLFHFPEAQAIYDELRTRRGKEG